MLITKPGFYRDFAIRAEYHNDPCPEPSLSRSVAKTILTRTPYHAWYEHPRLNPEYEYVSEDKFDIGTAAHAILLKAGDEIKVIDADSYRSKDARLERDTARQMGMIPLLPEQYERAEEAAISVRNQLGNFGLEYVLNGDSEVVCAGMDPEAGWVRCMFDKIAQEEAFDFKFTAIQINHDNLARHCAQMQYEFQQCFYERVAGTVADQMPPKDFTFIFVENKPPYAVLPVKLPPDAIAKGRANVDRACRLWAAAKKNAKWPMFEGEIPRLEYPAYSVAAWADLQEEAAE